MKSRVLAATALIVLLGAPQGWLRAASREPRPTVASKPVESDAGNPTPPEPIRIRLASIVWDGTSAFALDRHGQRHRLTLDRQAQAATLQLLRSAKPRRGAVAMISVPDARVLALSELPNADRYEDSLAWSAVTPSASLFKLVTTAALVERAQLRPDHRVCSEGGQHRLEARHLEAPRRGRIVCTTFSEILALSRNAAYARLVHGHLAPEDIDNFADRFGFNAPLPADFEAELGRLRVSADPLTFARTATGFVGSSLSVLGAAYLGLIVARGGASVPLQLLDEAAAAVAETTPGESLPMTDGSTSTQPQISYSPHRVILPNTAARLRHMMEGVVGHGTAADAFRDESGRPLLASLRVAGKTGTLGRDDHTASWFIGFAPSRNPKIALAVLLDNGPLWRTTAKHVASALMQRYFEANRVAPIALR